jgi:hypothetical protein
MYILFFIDYKQSAPTVLLKLRLEFFLQGAPAELEPYVGL